MAVMRSGRPAIAMSSGHLVIANGNRRRGAVNSSLFCFVLFRGQLELT